MVIQETGEGSEMQEKVIIRETRQKRLYEREN